MNNLLTTNTQNDGFSVTVASLLLGMGAEIYIPIFKKYNFGKKDIEQLTNEDLIIMGVDDSNIRNQILKLFQSKPAGKLKDSLIFTLDDSLNILKESSKILELTKLSVICSKRNVIYAKNPEDVLIKPNVYATDTMLEVIKEIETKLIRIRSTLQKNLVVNNNNMKIKVLAFGGITAFTITFCVLIYRYMK